MAGGRAWAVLAVVVPWAWGQDRDRVVALELEPPQREARLEYVADFEGQLFVRADGQGLELRLWVEGPGGSQQCTLGPSCTPLVRMAVEPGTRLLVHVAAPPAQLPGRASLGLICAAETPETKETAQLARLALDEAARARAAGELERTRKELQMLLEQLLAVPGRERSAEIEAVLWDAARISYELSTPAIAVQALSAVLEHREIVLPDDHPDLLGVRHNLASALFHLGRLQPARELFDRALLAARGCLPEDELMILGARANRANVLWALRELEAARAEHEQVVRVLSGVLSPDHLQLMLARQALALMQKELGDLESARGIEEDLLLRLESSRGAPLELELARLNLSATLHFTGDLIRARELAEQSLEGLERLVPEDHIHLQTARLNLGMILTSQGELEFARELQAQALEILERARPEDDADVLRLKLNLACTLAALGETEEAAFLEEQVLSHHERRLPPDHPDLLYSRQNLAITCKNRGDLARALELESQVLEERRQSLPPTHPDLLAALHNLAVTNLRLERKEAALELERELSAGLRRSIRCLVATGSPREIESQVAASRVLRDHLLSLAVTLSAEGDSELLEDAFLLSELSRNVGLSWAELQSGTRGDAAVEAARSRARAASAELAHLVRAASGRDEVRSARDALDARTKELFACLTARREGEEWLADLGPADLGRGLEADQALVAYVEYGRSKIGAARADERRPRASYLAWVLGRERGLELVDLGPAAPIEAAAQEWRRILLAPIQRGVAIESTGNRELAAGTALRELVLDPLRAHLEGVRRLIVVPDGVIHALPLDALPAADGGLLGEELSVELRPTLRELGRLRPATETNGLLVTLGGASYDTAPLPLEELEPEAKPGDLASPGAIGAVVGVLRGSGWERGFPPLPFGRGEALAIREVHAQAFADAHPAEVLEGRHATREALERLAPRSRFLHLATHGWFAAESVLSAQDGSEHSQAADGRRLGREEQVRGSAPMLLCGLALAGANLPPDELGRIAGLVTAEEIATWDLGDCELAVLSACDTHVGVRRAGQGVASLQRAVHMAGARSVITSLWKVPDEATQELMVDFYRRLWIEKLPKREALWRAKMKLRDARTPEGDPLHATRDWAAWVLSGEP